MGIGCLVAGRRRAVFVDRDGTLNRAFSRSGVSSPPTSESMLELLPGAIEAVSRLHRAGLAVIVVTNQPDVARGTLSEDAAVAINRRLRQWLPVDDLQCCFHDDADDCACRKPRPGMLLRAAAEWDIDLSRSFMIGDRWRDTGAGRRAGCFTVQLTGAEEPGGHAQPDRWAPDVLAATDIVLEMVGCEGGAPDSEPSTVRSIVPLSGGEIT